MREVCQCVVPSLHIGETLSELWVEYLHVIASGELNAVSA